MSTKVLEKGGTKNKKPKGKIQKDSIYGKEVSVILKPLSRQPGNKKSFTFPINPPQIRVSNRARYQTYDIIHQGTVQIPKGTEPDTISWSGLFFRDPQRLYTRGATSGVSFAGINSEDKKRQEKLKEQLEKEWKKEKKKKEMSPKACQVRLRGWLQKGTVLNLTIGGVLKCQVTINSFECTETGGYGNVEYNISFTRYRPLKIYTTKDKNMLRYTNARAEASASSHKVVNNDTLYAIAIKYYGSQNAQKWTKIYEANKELIEAEANKRNGGKGSNGGNLIYPGTNLKIPPLEG